MIRPQALTPAIEAASDRVACAKNRFDRVDRTYSGGPNLNGMHPSKLAPIGAGGGTPGKAGLLQCSCFLQLT
jgi:hypothetical protein